MPRSRETLRLSLIAAILLLILWPAPSRATGIGQIQLSCDFGTVLFDISFPAARLNSCKQTDIFEFSLSTSPENEPINPSPWYAFRVFSATTHELTVYLNYTEHTHRYPPKLSEDGENWQPIEPENVEVLFEGKTVRMNITAGPQGIWIAAQEILDNDYYDRLTSELAAYDFLRREQFGESLLGRPLYKLESTNPSSRYVVLVGRQHPPEISGAIGMAYFMQRLAGDDEMARQFRENYGLLMVPNLNPDGVEHGFWRHNYAGVDLNRDWGPFQQPETRHIREELRRFEDENGEELVLFLDFHSTQRDVFYTNSEEMRRRFPEFTESWLERIQQRMRLIYPQYEVNESPGYNATSAVSKNWVNEHFGIPAITVEYGDESDRQQVRHLSEIAAEEMMTLLLANTR